MHRGATKYNAFERSKLQKEATYVRKSGRTMVCCCSWLYVRKCVSRDKMMDTKLMLREASGCRVGMLRLRVQRGLVLHLLKSLFFFF